MKNPMPERSNKPKYLFFVNANVLELNTNPPIFVFFLKFPILTHVDGCNKCSCSVIIRSTSSPFSYFSAGIRKTSPNSPTTTFFSNLSQLHTTIYFQVVFDHNLKDRYFQRHQKLQQHLHWLPVHLFSSRLIS